MSELEPITREEMLLDGQDLEPITREEMFIKRIYDKTQSVPEPITRHEMFLKKAGDGGGEITVEELSVTANGDYSEQGKAYSPVHVNVEPKLEQRTVAISENGNYYYTPSEGKDGISRLHAVVNVPLPENGYLKKTATTSMSDAEQLPVASAKVTVTDKDVAKLYLTSDGVVSEDTTPYLYRQSPSGKSCVDLSIVGGTIAWNQLNDNGGSTQTLNDVTFTNNGDGSWTVNGTASADIAKNVSSVGAIPMITGHKYLICGCPSGGSANTYKLSLSGVSPDTGEGRVYSYTGAGANYNLRIDVTSGTEMSSLKFYPQVINLTQAFGTAIADYIYSLEQATAGSGIAWAKSNGYLTKKFYAYQSGKLESVNVASRKVVGFNQWDEEWELGYLSSTTGANVADSSNIRSKNYIPIIASQTYYCKASASVYAYFYDADKSFLGYLGTNITNKTFVSPYANAAYMRFYCSGTTYNNDICINISDPSKNGTYEPYTTTTYNIDSGELRGILKIDNDGNLYYDGDELSADGVLKRKYGFYTFTGEEVWTYYQTGEHNTFNSGNRFLTNSKLYGGGVMSGKYLRSNSSYIASMPDKTFQFFGAPYISITDDSFTDATEFAANMAGITIVYELATPTTESATPFTNPQLVGSTEEFIDAGTSASTPTRDVDIPVGQDSKYIDGNIYIKYLNSVTTGEVELADENVIIPLEDTTYISSNGSASVEYWSKED